MPETKQNNIKKKTPSVIAKLKKRISKNKETLYNEDKEDNDKSNHTPGSTTEVSSSSTVYHIGKENVVEKPHRKGKLKKMVHNIKEHIRGDKNYEKLKEKPQMKRSSSCNPVQSNNLLKRFSTWSLCSLTSLREAGTTGDGSDIEELIQESLDDPDIIESNFVEMHREVDGATSIDDCQSETALKIPFAIDEGINEKYIELKPESLDDLDSTGPTFVEMGKEAYETTYIDESKSQTALKTPFTTDENTGGVKPTRKPIIHVSNASPNVNKCGAMGSREELEEVDPGHGDREHGASCKFVSISIF